MTPGAALVHHCPGRARLRIPAKRGDYPYFQKLSSAFRECPGVVGVQPNTITGSLLVEHSASIGDVIAFGVENGFFELEPDVAKSAPMLAQASAIYEATQRRLAAMSGDRIDLRTVALGGLCGAALVQYLRGSAALASNPLVWYLASMLVFSHPTAPPSDA